MVLVWATGGGGHLMQQLGCFLFLMQPIKLRMLKKIIPPCSSVMYLPGSETSLIPSLFGYISHCYSQTHTGLANGLEIKIQMCININSMSAKKKHMSDYIRFHLKSLKKYINVLLQHFCLLIFCVISNAQNMYSTK